MNNNISRNGNGTTQACAACKYQRRKCGPNCTLAPYFPHDRQKQFLNAHKLFGVGKISKMIQNVPPLAREVTMATIIFQSDMRAQDPVGGVYRVIHQLQSQIEYYKAELQLTLHQLAICRGSSPQLHYNNANASLNHYQQQHYVEEQQQLMNMNMVQTQQLQEQNSIVEPNYNDVNVNHNFVPLQDDLNTWVNTIALSPLSLYDNKKDGDEEQHVYEDHNSDHKPILDLINNNDMNSSDTTRNIIDSGSSDDQASAIVNKIDKAVIKI